MSAQGWPTPHWPDGVSREIGGYEKPLFSILDESAREFPDRVYTVFSDTGRTYAQVKDTADRVANFLAGRGIRKGDRVADFSAQSAALRRHLLGKHRKPDHQDDFPGIPLATC